MSPAASDDAPACPEEKTAQSKIPGPGPVKDGEHLARVVLSPLHWKNGELTNDLLTTAGLSAGESFIRRELAGERQIKAHGENITRAKPGRKMRGYAVIKTADFRAIRDSRDRQAFCILDDECADAPAHAVARASFPRAKGETRALRDEVMDLLRSNLTAC